METQQTEISRVKRQFVEGENNGMSIIEEVVHIEDIKHHVNTGGPIIVLVNTNVLSCNCKWTTHDQTLLCCGRVDIESYVGNYIVVVGVNQSSGEILYRDPRYLTRTVCRTTEDNCNEARKFQGTDEDIIFVHRNILNRTIL